MKIFPLSHILTSLQSNILALKLLLDKQKANAVKAESDIEDPWFSSVDSIGTAAKEVAVDIQHTSNKAHWYFWIIGLIVVSVSWFLYSIFDWVLLIFTGVVMAIAIESLISYFEQKTSKRWLAILISYLLLVGLLLSWVTVMVPFLVDQISDLVLIIISWAQQLEVALKTHWLQDIIKNIWVYKYLMTFGVDLAEPKYIDYMQTVLQNNISAIVSFSSSYAKDAWQIVVSTIWWIISAFAQIWFVLTLSVLLSIEKNWFIGFIHTLSGHSLNAKQKLTLLYKKLGFWLKTQILLWLYIGVMMWIALLIMSLFGINIPNKWSLAVISALTELIPYLWPLLWWIPVIIMASISNWLTWFIVSWGVIFCIQWIENNILIPLLFKQNLGVSPVIIFLCMVLGWITIGINGVILAIPIAVIISILFSKMKL